MNALKAIIKSIVISCPHHLTVEQLQYDYKEIEGQVLPYRKYGFQSIEEMLRREMRDVVQIHGFGAKALLFPVVDKNIEHIVKLVTEQRSAKPVNKRRRSRSRSSTVHSTDNNLNFGRFSRQNNNTPKSFLKRSNKGHHEKSFSVRMSSVKEETVPETTLNIATKQDSNWNRYNSYTKDVEAIPNKDNRVRALDILRTYQKEIAEEKQEKSQTITPMCTKNADVHVIRREHAQNNNDEHVDFEKDDFKMLEQAFSELNLLESSIEETTPSPTCTQSPLDTDSSSSGVFFKPKDRNSCDDFNEAIPKFAFDNRILMLDFPESTVKFGTKIKSFEMSKDITVNSIISIYITEIHNPYRFWFHMGSEANELDDLMLRIENFYAPMSLTLEYNIRPELIQPGQVCATTFNNFWHRAEILTNIIIDNTVKVFFMDYGTVYSVDICSLKYLRTEFADLPAFAYRGCLGEISPIRLHWSTASSLALLSMSYERLLHAKVSEIDTKNRVYYLTICDTHEETVIHINRELVNMRFALKSFEWCKSQQLGAPRLRHKREDYPTFDMLEAGEYPTLTEIMNMEEKGISYESITDKMLYHSRILNFDKNISDALRDLPYYLLSNNPFASDIVKELTEKQ